MMTPQEREGHVDEFAEVMLKDSDETAKVSMLDTPANNDYWSQVRLFATALSQDQQSRLRKGTTVSLPLTGLSAANQATISASAAHVTMETNGVRTVILPDTVKFSFNRSSDDNRHMARDLRLGIGHQHSLNGNGPFMQTRTFLGMLEYELTSRLTRNWILPGDLFGRAVEKQVVTDLPTLPQESIRSHVPAFDRKLAQMAEAENFSYIGIVPEYVDHVFTTSRPDPQNLEYLSPWPLLYKWRNGVLLFNYPLWFYGDDAQSPYALVQQLRASKQRTGVSDFLSPDLEDTHDRKRLHPTPRRRTALFRGVSDRETAAVGAPGVFDPLTG